MSELDAIDVFALPTHPAADVFPMLGDQELAELADDIRLNGLLNPLVIGALDGQPVLVDGRNRREACRIVGVTPQVISLNGTDPVAYVLSANIHRRHMSKGAMAMAVARLLETNTQTVSDAAKDAGLNRTRIAQARTVLQFAPDLADGVMDGSVTLDTAYKTATDRKKRATGFTTALTSCARPPRTWPTGSSTRTTS